MPSVFILFYSLFFFFLYANKQHCNPITRMFPTPDLCLSLILRYPLIETDFLASFQLSVRQFHLQSSGNGSFVGTAPLPERVINSPFMKIVSLKCCRTYELHSRPSIHHYIHLTELHFIFSPTIPFFFWCC